MRKIQIILFLFPWFFLSLSCVNYNLPLPSTSNLGNLGETPGSPPLCKNPTDCMATLTWDPVTTMLDGSPLPSAVAYKMYWSTESGNYDSSHVKDNGLETTGIITDLTPGTYYFVVTAYLIDAPATESGYSNEASKNIADPSSRIVATSKEFSLTIPSRK